MDNITKPTDTRLEVWKCMQCGTLVRYNEPHSCKELTYTLPDPGHVIGAYNIYDEIDRLKKHIGELEKRVRQLEGK